MIRCGVGYYEALHPLKNALQEIHSTVERESLGQIDVDKFRKLQSYMSGGSISHCLSSPALKFARLAVSCCSLQETYHNPLFSS